MAEVDQKLKQKLEHLLEMGNGYVLDFTNAKFADFVQNSLGLDPYENRDGSKAHVLRSLWRDLPQEQFARLTIDMLEYRQLAEDLGQRSTQTDERRADVDRRLIAEVVAELTAMAAPVEGPTAEQATFLARDFDAIDLDRIQGPLDYPAVIADRLREIDICLEGGASLAVVFLCGSTLEGLLHEVAQSHPEPFNRAVSAPRTKGKVRPLGEWSLQDLLQVSRELKIVGEDVGKYADHVREFRNYIHPRQQLKEDFRPRPVTAQIARQVLRAAIDDLSQLSNGS